MSYRNDREAALARLEVLEAEHAQLVAANQELRAKRKRSARPSPAATQTIAVDDEPLPRFALLTAVVLTVLALTFITYALAA